VNKLPTDVYNNLGGILGQALLNGSFGDSLQALDTEQKRHLFDYARKEYDAKSGSLRNKPDASVEERLDVLIKCSRFLDVLIELREEGEFDNGKMLVTNKRIIDVALARTQKELDSMLSTQASMSARFGDDLIKAAICKEDAEEEATIQ